jgi:hypothetical protein
MSKKRRKLWRDASGIIHGVVCSYYSTPGRYFMHIRCRVYLSIRTDFGSVMSGGITCLECLADPAPIPCLNCERRK